MNDHVTTPSAIESAQTALQMLTELELDMSSLIYLARGTVDESVQPAGNYAKALELYQNSLGLLGKIRCMVASFQQEIETAAGIAAQELRDTTGTTCH